MPTDRNPYTYPGCEYLLSADDLATAIVCATNERAISYSLCEARHCGALPALVELLVSGPAPVATVKRAFHSAWVGPEGRRLRDNREIDDLLLEVLRKFMTGYSGPELELFRGEFGSNHE